MTIDPERRPGARSLLAVAALACALVPGRAHALPGIYLTSGVRAGYATMSSVVVMRDGRHNVVTIQGDLHGPPANVAMVLPVPAFIRPEDVRTLPYGVLRRLEATTAPRLFHRSRDGTCNPATAPPTAEDGEPGMEGAWDVTVLHPRSPSILTAWLRERGYHVSREAEHRLARYVRASASVVVASVPASRLQPTGGRALLAPIRVHFWRREALSLPLGIDQLHDAVEDVRVHVIARTRYEAANRPNVQVPTDLALNTAQAAHFDNAYDALFSHSLDPHPDAVVTEYARAVSECAECAPWGPLTARDLEQLGLDVAFPAAGAAPDPSHTLEVRAEEPRVHGPRTAGDVSDVVRRHLAEVRYCYQEALRRRVGLRGRVTVRASLNVDGSVRSARLLRASTPESTAPQTAPQCILRAVARWRFSALSEGAPETVDIPFVLELRAADDPQPVPHWARLRSVASGLVITRLHLRHRRGHATDLLLHRARADAASADFRARYIVGEATPRFEGCHTPSD